MKRIASIFIVSTLLFTGCNDSSDEEAPQTAGPVDQPSIDPYFQAGQEIHITDEGFEPQQLIAIVGYPIEFKNVSTSVQRIQQLNGGFRSGPIEPGTSFEFTPDTAVSIVYTKVGQPNIRGAIQVEPETTEGNG